MYLGRYNDNLYTICCNKTCLYRIGVYLHIKHFSAIAQAPQLLYYKGNGFSLYLVLARLREIVTSLVECTWYKSHVAQL